MKYFLAAIVLALMVGCAGVPTGPLGTAHLFEDGYSEYLDSVIYNRMANIYTPQEWADTRRDIQKMKEARQLMRAALIAGNNTEAELQLGIARSMLLRLRRERDSKLLKENKP